MPPEKESRLNLARKYRPQNLEQVLGQTVAVKTLSEALKKDRIAPAYLFSGPRGTGKTTCARIFARAATCLSKKADEKPCAKCASCLAHQAGKFMDLIEIDGASHTGVDDVRQIIDAVAYRPSVGARTVYIIDEVHMLSNAAFNALLKTLEEPPAHALFLFATTEQEKIPATILSRVQRIELQRLKEAEIIQNLKMISEAEKIKSTDAILRQIAAAADGSLRDAQTLLDQLILLSGSKSLDQEVVDSFLGTIGSEQEIEILELIAASATNGQNGASGENEISSLLRKTHLFFQQGKDLSRLLFRLLSWTRGLLLIKATKSHEAVKNDFAPESLERLERAFFAWSIEDTDRLLEIFWSGYDRIRKSELPLITFETCIIRASRICLTEDLSKIIEKLESGTSVSAPTTGFQATAHSSIFSQSAPKTPTLQPRSAPAPSGTHSFSIPVKAATPPPPSVSGGTIATNTEELLIELKKRRASIFAIISCAEVKDWAGQTLTLQFPKGHFAFRQASEKILQKELTELISQITDGRCSKLNVSESGNAATRKSENAPPKDFMLEAQKAVLNDPQVLKAAQFLNGKIESLTVSGVKTEVNK